MSVHKKFRKAIGCGIGKAYLIILEHPNIDFSKRIKRNVLQRMCYDGQCEGPWGDYYYQLICGTPQKDALIEFVLEELAKEQDDWYVLTQLYEIAALAATEDGNERAREVIWERFKQEYAEGDDWNGENALLRIAGKKALLGLARLKGKYLKKRPSEIEFGGLISEFDELYPKLNGRKLLRRASLQDPFIKTYWECVQRNNKPSKKRKRTKKKLGYKAIQKRIQTATFFWAGPWVDEIKDKTWQKLAEELMKETKFKIQERYLKLFAKRKFPLDSQILFDFVEQKKQSPKRLIAPAVEALAMFQSDQIRSYALERLKKKKDILVYLPLLKYNYKSGDHLLLDEILQKKWSSEELHDLNYHYRAIYKINSTKECMLPLKRLYGRLNCGVCREEILTTLYKNNGLKKGLLEEMKFDSQQRIRALYLKWSHRLSDDIKN
ncbi:hypothetical protein [Aureispira sp. CCB-QB1]|uniref:hypothetical protein n=1 Tax=Aureispira sp. CCB-QB1 TaxID=1313421 RepID=UPI000695E980|nr:hypothetical protein [Aureispira sp. CCB-QB1]